MAEPTKEELETLHPITHKPLADKTIMLFQGEQYQLKGWRIVNGEGEEVIFEEIWTRVRDADRSQP